MELLSNKAINGDLTASEWNGTRKEAENIITDAGITLSAGDQNQLGKAIADYIANADFYTDAGTANAHVISSVSSNQSPTAYKDGMRCRYRVNVTNTGATTVAVAGLAAKAVTINDVALTGGELIAGEMVEIAYHNGNGKFNIVLTEAVAGYRVNGWFIAGGVYDSVSKSVTSQDTSPQSIFFKDDGTKMYMIGDTNDTVYQYSLSTAWDVSTATYDSKSFSVAGEDVAAVDVFFKADGLKMYVVGQLNKTVYQYTLSTAWDISTTLSWVTSGSKSKSVTTEDTVPMGLFFKSDGTKMYMIGNTNDTVYQYTLSTAWDVSTATYDTVSFSVASEDTVPTAVFFKSDGLKMYMIGLINDAVHQYSLSTAWDLSTASYDSVSFNVISEDTTPRNAFFKDDGAKMYIMGNANDTVYQYSTNFLSAPV